MENTGQGTLPGNGTLHIRIGNLVNGYVHGGPYRNKPQGMYGVKLAPEVETPCDVLVPTPDFSVPDPDDLRAGVVKALMAMMINKQVYVGCFGGWGRTGIFLSALTKVQVEYRREKHRAGRDVDPVGYVRSNYSDRAVETTEQEEFIDSFDVSEIVNWLTITQRAIYGTGDFLVSDTRIGGEGDEVLRQVLFTNTPLEEVLNRSIPKGVITHRTSSKRDSIAEVIETWADLDEAHDNHRSQWKERWRDRTTAAADDWLENGGDSAGNLVDSIPESVQEQIDAFSARQWTLERDTKALLQAFADELRDLTKPKWYERIWARFQK